MSLNTIISLFSSSDNDNMPLIVDIRQSEDDEEKKNDNYDYEHILSSAEEEAARLYELSINENLVDI